MHIKRMVALALLGLTCLSQAQPSTFEMQRGLGQLTACQSNMKNIATALEMWSTDHAGKYPPSLEQLSPQYLRSVPTCPAAGADTYSSTYTGAPKRYAFACGGNHHAIMNQKPNHPVYDSQNGLALDPLPPQFAAAKRRSDRSPDGALTQCKSNLKNLATATEMWSADNRGRYPAKLSQLVPRYVQAIPTCPAAGADTYSGSFRSSAKPDNFNMCCQGHHHKAAGLGPDRPAYTAMEGLVER